MQHVTHAHSGNTMREHGATQTRSAVLETSSRCDARDDRQATCTERTMETTYMGQSATDTAANLR
eukprot:6222200-Amphidinium_carterae.4